MYHCYFLINYIGPPKVFFLSFGPLFKKFAHHWFSPLCACCLAAQVGDVQLTQTFDVDVRKGLEMLCIVCRWRDECVDLQLA